MAESYSFQVEIIQDGTWNVTTTAKDRSVADRECTDIARGLLEDWIIDNPSRLTGGGRVSVYGANPLEYPPDEAARVRILVFRAAVDGQDPEPQAAAYLLDPDAEDHEAWVNP
jgi:hypothetical protein